jgi:cell fate (sporulation/competence/biofilm development) regulator YlbF (YheA/YmcA/DUF963 family)
MKITIENKDFFLKFGMRSLMIYGRSLGLNSFNKTMETFMPLQKLILKAEKAQKAKTKKAQQIDLPFDVLELIENNVKAAVLANLTDNQNKDYTIDDVDVIDHLFKNPDDLQAVITNLMAAISSNVEDAKGKPQAQPN